VQKTESVPAMDHAQLMLVRHGEASLSVSCRFGARYYEVYYTHWRVMCADRRWVLVARRLIPVKNGEPRMLKTGSNMHLSGYDPAFVLILICDL